ncbi:hypothetical protein B0A52_02705 [Exophiala mesophila]|uniref:Uncharacterized protein n=1 Tax=Exophiala mesophila TaxID=212818 RepID=A0A438NDT2_EXOME|nr:hypothetical protein B0A52_02705 [Exophiala mesophila]
MAPRRRVNSLEALSAARAIRRLLSSRRPAVLFASLQPVQQGLIFKYLLKDYRAVLRLIDRVECLPAIHILDLQVLGFPKRLIGTMYRRRARRRFIPRHAARIPVFLDTGNHPPEPPSPIETDTETETDWEKDAYQMPEVAVDTAILSSDWNYLEDGEDAQFPFAPTIAWDTSSGNIASPSMDADLEYYPRRRHRLETDISFQHRISSQLLYYRLAAVFGMPPPRPSDGYHLTWSAKLQHTDMSVLIFSDHNGGIGAWFTGYEDGSQSALRLLNYLTGMQCRTGNGTVVGRRRY